MPNQTSPCDPQYRRDLILKLEKRRDSRVLVYFLSDRRGAQTQIADDAVRPMYDHLRRIGKTPRIDLYLYSVGGQIQVPWRIVTMIRAMAPEFRVLVPYKAMSAATMIALGADEIVMGAKGELGPIDPTLSMKRGRDDGTAVQEEISVEDIMSYVRFLRDKAGLTDQGALVQPLVTLAGKLDPWIIGQLNRTHSHIRSVARKLLTARGSQRGPDEQKIQVIVETLAEKTYQHGHAIGRDEAAEIGLNIVKPDDALEAEMWELFECYEQLCKVREQIDTRIFIPKGQDEHQETAIMGMIESAELSHHFSGDIMARTKRQVPPQIALNLAFNLGLPAGVNIAQLGPDAQQIIQQMLQQVQQQAAGLVTKELQRQMPAAGIEAWMQNAAWRQADDWPT